MKLRLGIPSKGRLQKSCIEWFAARSVSIERIGSDREYSAQIIEFPQIEVVLLSAGEIPRAMMSGEIEVGVTGQDMVAEKIYNYTEYVDEIVEMGFGFADLILAVPKAWIDVVSLDDFDAVAADFRKNHGHRLRVATKYHNLARTFLTDHDVADYLLVDSQGATEGAIKNHTAEAIIDITSSGSTLDANHLRVLDDGLILKSQATVFKTKDRHWTKAQKHTFLTLEEMLKEN